MRRLLLGGLSLVLGCLAAQAQARAQEIRWHSATARPATVSLPTGSTGSALPTDAPAATLGRPTGTSATAAPLADPQVRPVAFSQDASDVLRPIFRAKGSEVQKPLPPGPAIEGAEPLPQPKAVAPVPVPAPEPGAASTDCWGGVLTPMPGPASSAGGVMEVPGVPEGMMLGTDGPDCCFGDGCNPCCGNCCCEDGHCPLPGRVWLRGEYLLWFLTNPHLPTLVTTTGGLTGAHLVALKTTDPTFTPGALGQVGTQVVVGGSDLSQGAFSGARFTIGVGTPVPDLGVETTFFFLGSNTQNMGESSTGFPGFYRPFFNTTTGAQDAEFVAFPGVVSGNVNVAYRTNLWGAEANFRYPLLCGCDGHLDFLTGFRFISLSESLDINESVTFLVANPAAGVNAGDNIVVSDHFGTINHFYGGQAGVDGEWRFNRWLLGGTAKIALGSMHEVININGQTVFSPAAGGQTTATGGLLAQPTNIGHFSQDRFAVVPDIGLKVGYQITDRLKAYAGYDVMYLSDVLRAADQVDLTVNTTQLPTQTGGTGKLVGAARPSVPFSQSSMFVHGFKVGLEYDW